MKVGVVGTFIRDKILPWKMQSVESIGGIFFTVSYLANLLEPEAEVWPVCFVGEDFYETIESQLSRYPNVRLDGIRIVPRKNTQVRLTYTGPQERDEVTTAPMPVLQHEQLEMLQDADAVEVNLITGVDVDLNALKRFRQDSRALIYLDFHSHALGISAEGKRYYKRPADWREWIDVADVLQINEMEARTLAGVAKELPKEVLVDFGRRILQMQPSVCQITLAEKGGYVFYLNNDKVVVKRIKALPIAHVVDIIGCGDAFAAGYLVEYLRTKDVYQATKFANRVAGLNCTFMGSSQVSRIRKLLQCQN
ncbi:MAG: carbohydrate kinase family protein [bacterium]